MARGLNKVMLIGHVGQEPEVRYTPEGNAIASFTLATGEEWTNKKTGKKEERTEWHRLVAFEPLSSKVVQPHTNKGTKLYIEGSNRTRSWEDSAGQKRYTTEIVVKELQFLSPNPNRQESPPPIADEYSTGNQNDVPPMDSPPDDYDDDIPY